MIHLAGGRLQPTAQRFSMIRSMASAATAYSFDDAIERRFDLELGALP
jgi:hypothetical protein